MSAAPLEVFLARLYAEPDLMETFLAEPERVIAAAGLDADDAAAMRHADLVGLRMAAHSFGMKRSARRASSSARKR